MLSAKPVTPFELFCTKMLEYNASHSPHDIRQDIVTFERALQALPGACFHDCLPLKHSFADGCYVREIYIPKGTVYVGKIHRCNHPRFVLKGELVVITESGGIEHIVAPAYMITREGTKRLGVALEDSIIVTVHVTDKKDLKDIEAEIIAPDYEALLR